MVILTFFVDTALSGINETSRTLRRIDSAKMVRQAFPKTIFDNSDDPPTGSIAHERTKSDTYFAGFDEALTGMGEDQIDDPRRRKKRSGSVSSIVSDASTNSTATSASNPILVTRGNYSGATTPTSIDAFGTPMNGGQTHAGAAKGEVNHPMGDPFVDPAQFHPGHGKGWNGNGNGPGGGGNGSTAGWNPQFSQPQPQLPPQPQAAYLDPSVGAPGMNLNFPPMGHYPQNVQSPYAAGPYAGLDQQQQQIQLIQQQVLHNQMMFRWMMQQQNLAQAQAQAQGNPSPGPPPQMQQASHMAYPGWRGKPDVTGGHQDRGYPGGMNGSMNGRPKFANGKPKAEMKRQSKGSLLLRHKNSGYRPTFTELVGHVVEFSRDSHGSRLVQYMMETATMDKRQVLIDEVMEDAVALMQDLFGNYVMQNFLEHANTEQRIVLSSVIKGNTLTLSLQPHGCRVVQRAIEVLPARHRNDLIEELLTSTPKVIRCAKDPHATHVLQKATVQLQKDIRSNKMVEKNTALLRQIEQAVADDVLILAVHPNACRLVQRVLGRCNVRASTYIGQIMTIVYASYHTLAIDQHGNFILQHILDNGTQSQVDSVQSFVCSRVLELAQHKFGSHLVEKCLQSSTPAQAEAIVKELLKPTGHNEEYINAKIEESEERREESTLLMLMKDPYANFVVQRAFDASPGYLRSTLAKEIRQHAQVLNKFTYGRHILSHIGASEA